MRLLLRVRFLRPSRSNRRLFHQQSVRRALQQIQERLTAAGRDAKDANPLIANALMPRLLCGNDVFWHRDRKFEQEEANRLERMLVRRCKGEPLAYVVGHQEFWSLQFKVTRDTLIPRSDSEVLIETLTQVHTCDTPLRILDLGTGTGCLLVAALSEFSQATGVGIDNCNKALEVATFNAQRNNVLQRTTFMQCDMLRLPRLLLDPSTRPDRLYQQFDVILSNPPYIPRNELDLMANDVVEFEPHRALFSDYGLSSTEQEDESIRDLGLIFYKKLSESAQYLLDPHSHHRSSALIMEIGSEKQAKAVQALFVKNEKESDFQFEQFLFDGVGLYRGLRFSN